MSAAACSVFRLSCSLTACFCLATSARVCFTVCSICERRAAISERASARRALSCEYCPHTVSAHDRNRFCAESRMETSSLRWFSMLLSSSKGSSERASVRSSCMVCSGKGKRKESVRNTEENVRTVKRLKKSRQQLLQQWQPLPNNTFTLILILIPSRTFHALSYLDGGKEAVHVVFLREVLHYFSRRLKGLRESSDGGKEYGLLVTSQHTFMGWENE